MLRDKTRINIDKKHFIYIYYEVFINIYLFLCEAFIPEKA